MEKEIEEDIKGNITIGCVGKCSVKRANEIFEILSDDPNFFLVYFRKSVSKLWIQREEDSNDD